MVKNKIKGMNKKAWHSHHYLKHSPGYYEKPHLRPALKLITDTLGKDLVGAEVGVFRGENAYNMLKLMPLKFLYLIDLYIVYKGYKILGLHDLNPAKKEAEQKLSEFNEKIKWIIKDNKIAVSEIPDNLDFVYIDANHTYPYVKADLENYYPKVRKGGVLCGHDFGLSGVTHAVNKFVKKNHLKLHVLTPDWWIVKP